MTSEQRAGLAGRITAQPWAWCVQEAVELSTAPMVTDRGLVPRRTVLRTFGVRVDTGHEFLPGGLARVATGDGFAISHAQRPSPRTSGSSTRGLGRGLAAGPRRGCPHAGASRHGRPARRGQPRVARPVLGAGRGHRPAPAPLPRSGLRLRPQAWHAWRAGARRRGLAGERITGLTLGSADPAQAQAAIRAAVADPELTGSVAHSIRMLTAAAHEVPDIMSDDIWHVLSRFEDLVDDATRRRDLAGVLDALVVSCLAMAGINAESLTRDATWAFIDIGVRTERAQRTLGLVEKTFGQERAAIVETQLADAVAEIGESLITQRRRAASGSTARQPAMAVTHLLVLDATNPRSVAFQLDRLAEDLRIIGDEALALRVADLAGGVAGLDLPVLFDEGRPRWLRSSDGSGAGCVTSPTSSAARISRARADAARSSPAGRERVVKQHPGNLEPRRYFVRHRTTYDYPEAVTRCHERGSSPRGRPRASGSWHTPWASRPRRCCTPSTPTGSATSATTSRSTTPHPLRGGQGVRRRRGLARIDTDGLDRWSLGSAQRAISDNPAMRMDRAMFGLPSRHVGAASGLGDYTATILAPTSGSARRWRSSRGHPARLRLPARSDLGAHHGRRVARAAGRGLPGLRAPGHRGAPQPGGARPLRFRLHRDGAAARQGEAGGFRRVARLGLRARARRHLDRHRPHQRPVRRLPLPRHRLG
nr:alpha-E domain-containing protein [Tessaracoccus coleopterorum]